MAIMLARATATKMIVTIVSVAPNSSRANRDSTPSAAKEAVELSSTSAINGR
jgi:hypothetical protein